MSNSTCRINQTINVPLINNITENIHLELWLAKPSTANWTSKCLHLIMDNCIIRSLWNNSKQILQSVLGWYRHYNHHYWDFLWIYGIFFYSLWCIISDKFIQHIFLEFLKTPLTETEIITMHWSKLNILIKISSFVKLEIYIKSIN